MKVFDIHCHLNHNAKHDTVTDEFYKCDLDFLLKERKDKRITKIGLSTFDSVLSSENVEKENEYLFKLANNNPNVYQWVVIDPRNDKTFEQAKRMLSSQKVLGIKIHSIYHQYSFVDYADKVFKFANEQKCIVLMHPDNITKTAEIASKYKDMKLIIAHLGGQEHIDAIKNYENIYTDTSGSASFSNNIIEKAVEEIGSDRIMFGTDTYSAAAQLGRITFANISKKDKINILYKNAKKLFNDKF